jgi:hypothetical protein
LLHERNWLILFYFGLFHHRNYTCLFSSLNKRKLTLNNYAFIGYWYRREKKKESMFLDHIFYYLNFLISMFYLLIININ